jgi:hypothetical protein
MPCLSHYILSIFFNKIGEQEGRTGSAQKCSGEEGLGFINVSK